MNTELLTKIDEMIEASTEKLAADTIRLVNINSEKSEPVPGAPWGIGPRAVLDEVLKMGKAAGFYATDYNVGVVSTALKEGQPDLGIWLHGDVVAAGEGWNYPPYDATEYKGCIIGRGATDNKGQLAAIFNLLQIFKELGIELKYNPALYVGSNEELGMQDLIGIPGNPDAKGFLNVCTPPRMSLVPDSGWPVGYGGKGALSVVLRSKTPLHGIQLTAGQPGKPGDALAILDRSDVPQELPMCTVTKGKKTEVFSFSPPTHGAHPNPNGNMITHISGALLDAGLVAEEDKQIFHFLRTLSKDIHGHCLNIAYAHPIMGEPIVATTQIDDVDGYIKVYFRIRYPAGITVDEMEENIKKAVDGFGFIVEKSTPGTPAYLMNPDTKEIKLLTRIANEITGADKPPYTLSGGTYAHRLPNAYAFGMSGNCPPEDFPKGRGGAHGIDECVSLARLKIAMRIYARALLELNDILG
ncbi:MAG: M20/M25/M40 family metallo-hydrolase [Oscillospiraceae bacterium]|nr:M20/M25/M40 family metallo-hydrolase [Oscillospiraceae bacterium]